MNNDLTVGKPERVLRRFCLPLFGSIIFQQLYNIADSLVAGKFIGENALAAVGNSYEITLIFIAFAFGCNMGCSVTVSQLFGAGKYGRLKTAVSTTCIFSAAVCAVLMILGIFFGGAALRMIHTPDEIFSDSKLYLDIYVLGLPFVFFYNIATGIFSALGDSKTPFCFLAASSTSNIAVDILFVKVFDMGVAGVAWATFICQGISCILAVAAVIKRLRGIPSEGKPEIFSADVLKRIVSIAVPTILQQSFISVGNIMIQSVINSFGTYVMAGYSAAVKLNLVHDHRQRHIQLCGTESRRKKIRTPFRRLPRGDKNRLVHLCAVLPALFLLRTKPPAPLHAKDLGRGNRRRGAVPADSLSVLFHRLGKARRRRNSPRDKRDAPVHVLDVHRFDTPRRARVSVFRVDKVAARNLVRMANRLDSRDALLGNLLSD